MELNTNMCRGGACPLPRTGLEDRKRRPPSTRSAAWRTATWAVVPFVPLLALLAGGWKSAERDYAWSFPRDHWSHPGYRTEWWYFTGQLAAVEAPERRFGYQLTFFRVGLTPAPPELASEWATANLIMGHAAITDLAGGRHLFSELLYREVPLLAGFGVHPDPLIAWSRGPAGTAARWSLGWNGSGFDLAMRDDALDIGFELSTQPLKPLVFQGPGGYSRKSRDSNVASLYYSFTRLATEGSVRLGADRFEVRGLSWMDREFGSSQLGEHQAGWDWFSLQLEDRREIMLYVLRDRRGGTDFARGTVVSPQGQARYLGPADWELRVTRRWKSPSTSARYPAGWTLEIPGEDLKVRIAPLVDDQENLSRLAGGLFYWEGAVAVLSGSGSQVGSGYVELTGYGTNNRPPI